MITQQANETLTRLTGILGEVQSKNPALGEQLGYTTQEKDGGAILTFDKLTAGDVTNYAINISTDGEVTLGRKKWADGFVAMETESLHGAGELLAKIAGSYNDTFIAKKTVPTAAERPVEMVYASGKAYPRKNLG